MTEAIRINFNSQGDMPSIQDIGRMADAKHHVVLQFPCQLGHTHDKQSIIKALGADLPDHSVFDSGSDQKTERITVMPVVSERVVHSHLASVKSACAAYGRTCAILVSKRKAGTLSAEWTAAPHGRHILFENHTTGQVVEAPQGDAPATDDIDPYFFAQFVKTTAEWSDVAAIICHDYHDARRIIDVLSKEIKMAQPLAGGDGKPAPQP